MISRVTKFDAQEEPKLRRMRALLDSKGSLDDPAQPTINAYYRDHFNTIDNFNKCLHVASWPYDVHHEHMFYLISCLRMTTINILAVYFELRGIQTKPNIRVHVEELAVALLK